MQGAARKVGPKKDQANSRHSRNVRIKIAERAYELWTAAGHPAHRDLEFWLQAETELEAAKRSRHRKGGVPEPGPAQPRAHHTPARSREAVWR